MVTLAESPELPNTPDLSGMKLGKCAARTTDKVPCLASYIVGALPKAPSSGTWGRKVPSWGMLLNDRIGDCAIATPAHMIQAWTSYELNKVITLTDQQILTAYSAVSGYDPRTGLNDNGCVVVDVLRYWQRVGIGGHKIDAWAGLEPGNQDHVRLGCYLFGGVYLGVSLPNTAKQQKVWSVPTFGPVGPGQPGSWGGHAVPVVAYGAQGVTVVTWGTLKQVTWGFMKTYCDEAYIALSKDWISDGQAPNGLDLATLQADLKAL